MASKILWFTGLFSWPFAVAHEFTHFITAHAATREAKMALTLHAGERGSPGGISVWPPIDSKPIRVFVHLSPTVFGCVLMGLWVLYAIPLEGWRWIMALGLFWYTFPSPSDVRGALGRQTAQQEADS